MPVLLLNEFIKLKRSLVLLVCLAAPLCAAGFEIMIMLGHPGPRPWVQLLGEGAAVWAYFLLPMAVTALTVLTAQIEHGARMWNHLMTLPRPRAGIFAAKIVTVVILLGFMTLVLYAALYGAVIMATAIVPGAAATGDPQWGETFLSLFLMDGAALTMTVIQLWLALRFRSFALPLVVGIVGTFLALATQAAHKGIFLPWLAPAYTFTITNPSSLAVVIFGYAGGIVLAPLMILHLARHQREN
ncbi:MAG: ABC transporter permease [Asticcacaulis sp.]